MTDEIKNRLECIKGSLIRDTDERLQQCTLNDMDYIEFLNDQEFAQIKAIQDEINTCTSLRKANTMLNMLLDDIAAYGDEITKARDRLLADMEQSANRQEEV